MSHEPVEEIVDAEVVSEPGAPGNDEGDLYEHEVIQDGTGRTLAVVPTSGSMEVMRPLDSEQLVESFRQYQDLRGKLLTADDYQSAGRGKSFVKKSGWRKIATAFGLSVQRVEETVDRDDEGNPTKAKAIYRAVAPNGRFMDGDGYCDVSEERFSGPRGNKSKLENDLRATAATRAKNRAISDLVGMGEVSAEEVGGAQDSGPEWGPESTEQQANGVRNAIGYLLTALGQSPEGAQVEAVAIMQKFGESYGYIPGAGAGAIILLAKHVQSIEPPKEQQ